jgi:hypothetical protein
MFQVFFPTGTLSASNVNWNFGMNANSNNFVIASYNGTAVENRITFVNNGNVLINTNTDVASAIFNVSSTTKGFLPPRMTTTQKNAISSPAAGLVVYDTTLNKLCVYTTAWETITSI